MEGSVSLARSTTAFRAGSAPTVPAYKRRTSSIPVAPNDLWYEKSREEEDICQKIHYRMKRRDEPNKAFICETDLTEIWAERATFARLFAGEQWHARELNTVRDGCIKILSLLVWIRATKCIPSFHDFFFPPGHGLSDEPIFSDEHLVSIEYKQLADFDIERRTAFIEERHCFAPIKIEEEENHDTKWIPPESRLPWAKESKDIGMGGYGTVRKVTIPAGYLVQRKFSVAGANTQDEEVACKLIERTEDFSREVKNLSILRESITTHANILRHMSTMIQGRAYYILLPLAVGDLELFLNEGRDAMTKSLKDDIDQSLVKMATDPPTYDLITQSLLLADALKWLHHSLGVPDQPDMYCIHSDLKPTNVLIMNDTYSSVGRWLFSDFGLSVIEAQTGSQDTHVLTIGDAFAHLQLRERPQRAAGTYQAPEVQLKGLNPVGRKSDVWSLACIFSEVIAFALGRSKLLSEFQDARKNGEDDYFYSPKDEQMYDIRPSVLHWLQALPGKYPEQGAWVSCCVQVITRSLTADYEARPDADNLRTDLQHARDHFNDPELFENTECPSSQSTSSIIAKDHHWTSNTSSDSVVDSPSLGRSSSSVPIRSDSTWRLPSPPSSQPSNNSSMRKVQTPKGLSESHGISPDGFRDPYQNSKWSIGEARTKHVKDIIRDDTRVVTIALSPCGTKILWITRSNIHVVATKAHGCLTHECSFAVPVNIGIRAASIAGNYVCIFGNSSTSASRKAAYIYDTRSPRDPISIPETHLHPSMRGVAVAENGKIIMLHPMQLILASFRSNNHLDLEVQNTLSLPPNVNGHGFHCATFSPSGHRISAWSWGRGPEMFYCWEWSESDADWYLRVQAQYKNVHVGLNYDVEQHPIPSGQACILRMKASNEFFVASTAPRASDGDAFEQNVVQLPDVQLSCALNDNWLITAEERYRTFGSNFIELKRHCISEQGGRRMISREGEFLCKLHLKVSPQSSVMRVSRHGDATTVIICSQEGNIVFIPLVP